MKKTLNALIATLVLAGTGFSSVGCSGAIDTRITQHADDNPESIENCVENSDSKKSPSIEDSDSKTPEECYCLKENEHVLPNKVVENFLSLVFGDARAHLYLAYYFNGHELHPDAKTEMVEIEKTFYKKMSGLGYSPEETLLYLVVLNQPSGIVIKESSFREPVSSSNSFKDTLEHERIHYEFDKRPRQEKEMLLSFHQEIIRRDDVWNKFSHMMGLVFYNNNFGDGEFVAHLVQRAWYLVDSVKTEFPREYDVLREIREAAEAKLCECDFVVK